MAGLLIFWLRDIFKYALATTDSDYQKRKKTKIVASLATLFLLLIGDIMGLNILYYLNVRDNPGYNYKNVEQEISTADKVVISLTVVVVIAYWCFYIVGVVLNCKHIKQSTFK